MVSVIDDFEDTDFSEYSGSPDKFSRSTNQVSHGTYSAQANANQYETANLYTATETPLPDAPEPGDTFEISFYMAQWSNAAVTFQWSRQDSSPFYEFSLNNFDQDLSLDRESTTLASASVSTFPTNEWLRFQVDWGSNGDITVGYYDSSNTKIAEVSATDTEITTKGGVYIDVYSGNTSFPSDNYVDYFAITQEASGSAPAAPSNLSATLQ